MKTGIIQITTSTDRINNLQNVQNIDYSNSLASTSWVSQNFLEISNFESGIKDYSTAGLASTSFLEDNYVNNQEFNSATSGINNELNLLEKKASHIVDFANVPLIFSNNVVTQQQNTNKYYGYYTKMAIGKYNIASIPFFNRVIPNGNAFVYFILLDKNDNTLLYKRLFVGTSGASDGEFDLNFDSEIEIADEDYYTVIIGFRKFGNGRESSFYRYSPNQSNNLFWVSTDNALNQDDTSLLNFSNITKNPTNEIIRGYIYKN